jgi:hypothetical protein
MRCFGRILPFTALALVAGATALTAQQPQRERSDSWQWYLGPQAGVTLFETPTQSRGGMPMVGGHLLVMARTGGLMLSYEEGIGSDETSSMPSSSGTGVPVTFNNIRRYSGIMTVFPWSGSIQPYLGTGFGIQHVVNPNVGGVFDTPGDAADAQQEAVERAGAGFVTALVGLQLRPTNAAVLYASYQLVSSAGGRLVLGPTHTFSAGLRIGMGRWKKAW